MGVPRYVALSAWTLPGLGFAVAAFIILTVVVKADLVFALHPLFMTAAFILCMPYAIGAYRMEVLDAESQDLGAVPAMSKLRTQHMLWQIGASCFALLGLVFIIAHKMIDGYPVLEITFHNVFGWAVLLGVAFQAVTGFLKVREIDLGEGRSYKFHGITGLVVYLGTIVAICTGAAELVLWESLDIYSATGIAAAAVIVGILIFVVRFTVGFPGGEASAYDQLKGP